MIDLRVDVDHIEGRAPTTQALDALKDVLGTYTDKHEIIIEEPEPIPGLRWDGDRVWDRDALQVIQAETYDADMVERRQGSALVLQVLYLDGTYEQGDTRARGLQVGPSLVLFLEYIDEIRTDTDVPHPNAQAVERHVLVHEAGHAMGLVDCGIPMLEPREDPESRCHSTNEESVMHVRFDRVDETLDMVQEGTVPYTFDAADRADLQAFLEEGRERAGRRA